MELWRRKNMFGDKSIFGSSYGMVKTCPKMSTRKDIFLYIKQGSITHSLNVKKCYTLYFLQKSAHSLKELGNET